MRWHPFLEIWAKVKKLSKIKPPLGILCSKVSQNYSINYPLILTGAQVILRQKLNNLSNKLNKRLQIIIGSDSQTYTESFINEGLAYSIGPAEASYKERKNNIFFAREIIEPQISRSVVICWPKVKKISKAAQITAQNLLLILKELHTEDILVGEFLYHDEKKRFMSM